MSNIFLSTVALPMPENKAGTRGGTAKYPLDKLEVGKSIVVLDKTKKQLNTTISTANKREFAVIDAKGQPVKEPVKDATGTVTGTKDKTEFRFFFAQDCDPATDPEKAMSRIWRTAPPTPPAAVKGK